MLEHITQHTTVDYIASDHSTAIIRMISQGHREHCRHVPQFHSSPQSEVRRSRRVGGNNGEIFSGLAAVRGYQITFDTL
jgi:hypothetical protein